MGLTLAVILAAVALTGSAGYRCGTSDINDEHQVALVGVRLDLAESFLYLEAIASLPADAAGSITSIPSDNPLWLANICNQARVCMHA